VTRSAEGAAETVAVVARRVARESFRFIFSAFCYSMKDNNDEESTSGKSNLRDHCAACHLFFHECSPFPNLDPPPV